MPGLNSIEPDSAQEWAEPSAGLSLGEEEVHVWRCSLRESGKWQERFFSLLAEEERERAGRFLPEDARERFVVSHGALREILGSYLSADPGALVFGATEYGKPFLRNPPGESGMEFNLSHSQDMVLVAVTRGRRIGVDVEHLRDLKDSERLAQRFFSEEEREHLESRPPGDLKRAFFTCWTRKEAYVKGLGRGIGYSLSSFSTVEAGGGPAATVHDARRPPGAPPWSLFNLPTGAEYAGAVAVEDFTGAPSLFRHGAGRGAGEGDV